MKKIIIIVIVLIVSLFSSRPAKAWWVAGGFNSYPITPVASFGYSSFTPAFNYYSPVYYTPIYSAPISSFGYVGYGGAVAQGLRETGFMLSRSGFLNYSGYYPYSGFSSSCFSYCY